VLVSGSVLKIVWLVCDFFWESYVHFFVGTGDGPRARDLVGTRDGLRARDLVAQSDGLRAKHLSIPSGDFAYYICR
jgi:hypothetical protein